MNRTEAIVLLGLWTSKNEEMDETLLSFGPENGYENGLCGKDEIYTGDATYRFAMELLRMIFNAVPEEAENPRYKYLHDKLIAYEKLGHYLRQEEEDFNNQCEADNCEY